MKQKLLALAIAASLGLAGCGQPEQNKQQAADKTAMEEEMGQAELGSFGVDLSARNEAVKPGDDFFMYAGGTWSVSYTHPTLPTSDLV